MLKYRKLENTDLPFFKEVIKQSPKWRTVECEERNLKKYIGKYADTGEWRIWQDCENVHIAITYHQTKAESTNQPWFGTILIHHDYRSKGLGIRIVNQISDELKVEGHAVVFAAVPIQIIDWSTFLAKCRFEQYKLEKDEEGNSYLIMAKPL